MNKKVFISLLAGVSLIFSAQLYASSSHDAHSSGHGTQAKTHDMAEGHDNHGLGMKIHQSSRDGYTLEYRVIDMKEKMAQMENMPEIKDTHHLMVFVKDGHGAPVKSAKVGYLIQEKGSGAVQKKMAMEMNNGFGADVTLVSGNHYVIKTKVVAEGKNLMDEFEYMGGDH